MTLKWAKWFRFNNVFPLIQLSSPAPGIRSVYYPEIFTRPVPNDAHNGGEVFLGRAISSGSDVYLDLSLINKHVALMGATGTGKTTTAIALAVRITKLGIPVLIIDWNGEYSSLPSQLGGVSIELGKPGSKSLNPLDPSGTTDIYAHIDTVSDVFSDIFEFTAPQSHMFLRTLLEEFNARGYSRNSRGSSPPTISDILERVKSLPPVSRFDYEIKQALERRLLPLTVGAAGQAFDRRDTADLDYIMKNFCVIDLSEIRSRNQKRMIVSVLLKIINDYCLRRELGQLSHVTIVEEAQNIIPPRRIEENPSIGERMIAELRKYGEGIIVVAQLPSQISKDVIKNCSVRIVHSLKSFDDQQLISDTVGFDPKELWVMRSLREGEALLDITGQESSKLVYVEALR